MVPAYRVDSGDQVSGARRVQRVLVKVLLKSGCGTQANSIYSINEHKGITGECGAEEGMYGMVVHLWA